MDDRGAEPARARVEVVTRAQLEASLAALCAEVTAPAAGLFGPTSLAWRLGGDVAIFAGGGRAALMQLAHPFVAHAIDQHSRTRADVAGRFERTFRSVFAMVFGTLDEAVGAARRVHAVHARIHGELAEAHGAWPAGTRYHASDPEALRWVHATLVDTVLVVRAALEGPLPVAHRDRYVAEMSRFAALFGIPPRLRATTWAAHDAYVRAMLVDGRLAVTPAAREMAAFLFGRGAGPQPALGRLAEAVTAAMLPPPLGAAFALRASPRAGRAAIAALRAAYARLPASLVMLPARAAAVRRLQGRGPAPWTAWAEAQLAQLARSATGAPAARRR